MFQHNDVLEIPRLEETEPQRSTSNEPDAVSLNYDVDAEEVPLKLSHVSEHFSLQNIRGNDSLILLYTGLPTFDIFMAVFSLIENIGINYYLKWKVTEMSKEDQLLLTLMKLRQNFPQEDLAVRFNVSQATVSNVVITWIHVLHEILFKQLMAKIPPRSKNKTCLLNSFSPFENCRIIIDFTEVCISVPRQSMYKHGNTCKGLVGVAPNGVVTYVSCLYLGSVSDKNIVKACGILNQLDAGDLVLVDADKGFLIKDLMPPGVHINIPPFLTTPQLAEEQVRQTECIDMARMHVERAIRRMKTYKILSFVPDSLLHHVDAVFQVVGALTNLQYLD